MSVTESCESGLTALGKRKRERCLVCSIGVAVMACAAFAVPLVHCTMRSPNQLFWTDEVLTATAVCDASLGETLASLHDTINAMPPTYFVGVWLWSQVFGSSDFALRLFSAVCVGLAWAFCWLILRTYCSRLTAFTASATALFCSDRILFRNVEARCYPLYMAAFFAAGFLFVICSTRSRRAGPLVMLGTFVAHATLVTTHYIGCIYSGFLICTAIICYAVTRSASLRGYVYSAAGGAAVILLCIPFYLAQKDLGGADNWLPVPGIAALVECYAMGLRPSLHVIILVCAVFLCGSLAMSRLFETSQRMSQSENEKNADALGSAPAPVLFGVFALGMTSLIVPFAIWLESRVGIRLFLNRYMLPSLIVWPCILGLAIEQLTRTSRRCRHRIAGVTGRVAGVLPVACCMLLLCYTLLYVGKDATRGRDRIESFERIVMALDNSDSTFASTDIHKVLPVRHYGGRGRFVRRDVTESRQPRAAVRIAESLNRRYWSDLVISSKDLKRGEWKFVVFSDEWEDWQDAGIVGRAWRVVDRMDDLVLVERHATEPEE